MTTTTGAAHLTEERLFELGLDAAMVPDAGETAHLAGCAECASSLAAERELSAAFAALPLAEPPPRFVAATTQRFAAARAAEAARAEARRAAFGLAAAALALVVVAVPTVMYALDHAASILTALVGVLKEAAVVAAGASAVAGRVTWAPLVVSTVLAASLVLWSAGMGRLATAGAHFRPVLLK